MFNDTVTLFCRFGPKKADAFSVFILTGVNCTAGQGQAAAVPQAQSRNRAMLLIPYACAAGYLAPAAWHSLPPEQRARHWTLQPGDVFVPGARHWTLQPGDVFVPGAHPGGPDISPAAFLQTCEGFVVTTVTQRNTKGPMAHFAVGAGSLYQHGGGVL